MATRPAAAANRNNLKQTPIPVVSRTMPIVNPDGTVTRSGQLLLEQLQPATTTYGDHADRPDPGNVSDGAVYIEIDRGSIYQNVNGVWRFITGTMWATLNPDQRPTDLGVNDGGFDFRTTDDPAREFIWSQTEWIEATPVRYGTHAARLAVVVSTVIDQLLWVETDRGVLYQLQDATTWQYIAGTMWGTMVPDQRPTDLGAHDAGFDYRSTDAPPREFIWSQTAWVETTPQAGLLQIARSTSNLTLTTTATPIPGVSLTLARAGVYLITGAFDFVGSGAGDSGSGATGILSANGAVQPNFVVFVPLVIAGAGLTVNPTPLRVMAFQQWSYFASTPGQVVLLEASKNLGTGASVTGPQTTISALWVSPS